ncbi:hypothetical protein OEZ85_003836 [Tetradesmus obliquus]|uniref:Cytochrome b561 domain-containing protein n=1 Tax=Tetradesmus obliquus TaxID=3088 RepID=A0ABY8UFJ5_TETOB|nr:hypothetical protein OEZ85_003836 [Tetradesmus obliquus]
MSSTAECLPVVAGSRSYDSRLWLSDFGYPIRVWAGSAARPCKAAKLTHVTSLEALWASGLGTVNQHPGLLSLASVFLREHNRRAAEAVRLNPSWGDEEAFQYARKWVIAHWQHVVFDEYITALLGATLPQYTSYNESTNPGIDNFFASASYRYGHATITDVVFRLDEHWQEHPQGHLLLSQAWFQPDKALSAGIEPLLRGYVASPRGQVGMPFASAVQQNLFGPSHINGTDLLAINIQRGRDHGLPDYNICRRGFGLAPATSFRNITPDAALASKLEQLYGGNINNIDAYVGGLAEPHVGNAHVGALFYASILDQFTRLRDGDWYYYKNADNGLFTPQEVAEIDGTGLRDIIMRNTNITELPDSVWVVAKDSVLGVCPADAAGSSSSGGGAGLASSSSSSGNASVAGPFKLLDGAVELTISKAADPSKMRVQVVGRFDKGFIGFGVAKPDQPIGQKMVGADMVISRMVDGKPSVLDYHAIGHIPPILDTSSSGSNDVTLIRYERSGGQTVSVFERPFAASDGNGLDSAVLQEGPNTFIVSHGANDDLIYHGIDNRAVLELKGPLFGGNPADVAIVTAADPLAVKRRTQHGCLMAVNFILVFPLGALLARQLRARWLNSLAAKAVLFYMHIALQMSGVALATAGFIIATKDFGIPYKDVLFHHGTLGVTILTLVYFQLLIGFVRPPAASDMLRALWQLGHAMLGRCALMLGMVNVFIGIYLFGTLYKGNIGLWGGLAAAGVATIALLQIIGDLLERRASEMLAARMANLPPGGKPPPTTTASTPRGGDSFAHGASNLTDDDINPSHRDPGYSPGPAADDQFKSYSAPQPHFGGGQFGGPGAASFGGGGGFIGGVAAGFSPPGGSGLGSSLCTTNNSSALETPRLPYSAAADPNNGVFCDYETAGVYDPASGAFKAAGHTKKPPVQELHLPSSSNTGLGLGIPHSAPITSPAVPRRSASTSSVNSGSNGNYYAGSSSGGGDMLGRTGSNWREAAAAALQRSNAAAETGNNAYANGSGSGNGAGRGSSAYGANIASKLAAAQAALDSAAAAAAPGSPKAYGDPAGDGSSAAGGGGGSSSSPTVRLTTSMLDRHNRA